MKDTIHNDRKQESPESNSSIPKNINECIAPAPIAQTILRHQVAIDRIEIIVIAVSIVSGIFTVLNNPRSLFQVVGIVLAEYVVFTVITSLLGALASLVQNKAISTNLEVFKTYREISATDNNTSSEEL